MFLQRDLLPTHLAIQVEMWIFPQPYTLNQPFQFEDQALGLPQFEFDQNSPTVTIREWYVESLP